MVLKKILVAAIYQLSIVLPLVVHGQQYLTIDNLCLLATKEYDDVYAIKSFANKRGYYSKSLQGFYVDEFSDTLDFFKIDRIVNVEYKVKASPQMIKQYEEDMKNTCRYWFRDENDTRYHLSANGRFTIVLRKKKSQWQFSVRENKKGDPVPAFAIEKNKMEINSYTDVAEIYMKKGDTVTLKATGSIKLGLFAGESGPDGIDGFELYSYNKAFRHGALIGKIGENGAWFLIGSSKTFIANEAGVLMVAVNDIQPSNNSGRCYLEYEISK